MSIVRVKKFFNEFGISQKIQEFNVSSATVELAAKALNTEPERIAKSLTFKIGEKAIMIILAGNKKIDNSKYKLEFNVKAKMLSPDEVETFIGHTIGGVCPFGINPGVNVYLDISLKNFETVFPACGSSNSAIELTIPELEKYSSFTKWIDVSK